MKTCIRCGGPVYLDWDADVGWYWKCLSCGRRDAEVTTALVPWMLSKGAAPELATLMRRAPKSKKRLEVSE